MSFYLISSIASPISGYSSMQNRLPSNMHMGKGKRGLSPQQHDVYGQLKSAKSFQACKYL